MVARVTLAEIDTMRMALDDAVRRFEGSVLPRLREQDGYEGGYVLATPEGRALVMTFWTAPRPRTPASRPASTTGRSASS
jgi:hypothetical protein